MKKISCFLTAVSLALFSCQEMNLEKGKSVGYENMEGSSGAQEDKPDFLLKHARSVGEGHLKLGEFIESIDHNINRVYGLFTGDCTKHNMSEDEYIKKRLFYEKIILDELPQLMRILSDGFTQSQLRKYNKEKGLRLTEEEENWINSLANNKFRNLLSMALDLSKAIINGSVSTSGLFVHQKLRISDAIQAVVVPQGINPEDKLKHIEEIASGLVQARLAVDHNQAIKELKKSLNAIIQTRRSAGASDEILERYTNFLNSINNYRILLRSIRELEISGMELEIKSILPRDMKKYDVVARPKIKLD